MFRILKTLQKIFQEKQKTASPSYISGFGDCLGLLRIGLGKTSLVNPWWENIRLKRMLFQLLNFQNTISKSRLSKINDLCLQYSDDCIIIDKLYYQLKANQPNSESVAATEAMEIKLQNFMLKEVLIKLIHNKFKLNTVQKNHLLSIMKERDVHNSKIDRIVSYLISIDIDTRNHEELPIEIEEKKLRQQLEIKTGMVARCTENTKQHQEEIAKSAKAFESLKARYIDANKKLRDQVLQNQVLISNIEAMQKEMNTLEAIKAEQVFLKNRISLMEKIIEEKNKSLSGTKTVEDADTIDISDYTPLSPADYYKIYYSTSSLASEQNDVKASHTDKENALLIEENALLIEIVNLFIKKPMGRYDKYNMANIFNSKENPVQKYESLIKYQKQNGGDSIFIPYRLTESAKVDIQKMLSGTITQESYQELFNYISYLLSEDRKGKTLGKPQRAKKNG